MANGGPPAARAPTSSAVWHQLPDYRTFEVTR